MEHQTLRYPPQAVDVERHVIGAMILDPEAQAVAIEMLSVGSFYVQNNREVFRAVSDLFAIGAQTDLLTIAEHLRKTGNLERAGGEGYLLEISGEVVTSSSISEHCEIVREKAVLRALIDTATRTLDSAYAVGAEADQVVAEAESGIFAVSQAVTEQKLVHVREHLKKTFEVIEERSTGAITGIPTGIAGYDSITGGLHKSELIILAGRPKMGKTALGLGIAAHAASVQKKVAFFSLEMAAHELCIRILGLTSGVANTAINMGRFGGADAQKVHDASKALTERGIWIDAAATKRPMEILSQCKRLRAQHGLDLIVVDYLQLLAGNEKGRGNREQEVASISRFLKRIAMEMDLPVLCLAQLSRDTEKRSGDIRPRASDLRESGSIEQDANVVALLHRPEYYDKNAEPNRANLIIDLSRNCPPFEVDLTYHGATTRYSDYAQPSFNAEAFTRGIE